MINCIIVDDEKHCIDRLSSLLTEYFSNEICIINCFSNITNAEAGILNNKPDLLFLDVEIGKETGFQLLERLKPLTLNVVFTTAFDKFAVRAFKHSAVDYLLKPIDKDELNEAILKVKSKLSVETNNYKINTLLYNLNANQSEKRICLPDLNGITVLEVKEIISCESDSNYTIIYKKDKTKLTVSKTLKEVEEMLEGLRFFRVHHSHLINMNYIKNYHKGKGGSVTMIDGSEIEVSTRRKEDFIKELTK